MPTGYQEIWNALGAPFADEDVKSRVMNGRDVRYVTARAVMDRFDEVLGFENWFPTFAPGQHSVVCSITVTIPYPDGSRPDVVITKSDAGSYGKAAETNNALKAGDVDKAGFSDALKRAAVHFNVGRYLYRDKPSGGGYTAKPACQPSQSGQAATRRGNFDNFKIPPAGRAVYAWACAHRDHFQADTIGFMRSKGEELGFGTDFVSWDDFQKDAICGAAIDYLKSLSNYKGEFGETKPALPSNAKADAYRAIKLEIMDLTKQVCRNSGEDPNDNAKVMDRLRFISSGAAKGNGSQGEEIESLAKCNDGVWLANIKKEAIDVVSMTSSGNTIDDDIPF